MSLARRFCLLLARLTLAAWVGAAALFVVNGIRLVTSDAFDSVARDHIALLRFPQYYWFGFTLVAVGLFCTVIARPPFMKVVIALIALSFAVMLADFGWVYQPLEAMITPPGQPRSPTFETYHKASMIINTVHVGMSFVAVVLLSWPSRRLTAGDA